MPYLNDEELASLHKTIDDAKDETAEANRELEEIIDDLEKKEEDLKKFQKSRTIQNVFLSLLVGGALALAYFFYSTGGNSDIDSVKIEKLEAKRILDSIKEADETLALNNTGIDSLSVDSSVESIKNNVTGETVYSVQIGAFTKNRYTLLSETLAGISFTGDLFKYSIGLFKTLQEAQDFRKELIKIGFDDAFVASYIDGIRQEIEDPN